MSLIYNPAWKAIKDSNEKFWAFYALNKEEFNNLLWQVCWTKKRKYLHMVDINDLHTDLLLSVHHSKFLDDYNPEKSQFGTFVTGRVKGYAQHLITKIFRAVKKLPKDLEDEGPLWMGFEDYDGGVLDAAGLNHNPQLDDSLTFKQVYESVKKDLTKSQQKILDLHYRDGYKLYEVAETLKMTSPQITLNIPAVKAAFIEHAEKKGLILNKVPAVKGANGHAVAKKRVLTDSERARIREFFVKANGIIKADASLKLKETLGRSVTIFQVVGAINGFHRQVNNGTLSVENMEAYKENIQARRDLWKTYKSNKYQPGKFSKGR